MCVRCGTGRVAWCTDPYRHGESTEPVSPGDPPVVSGMAQGFHVDVMTCSFCPWKADGHRPEALSAWEAHMASAHPVYWDQRNTVAATLRAYGVKGHGDCGRLAMAVLTSLSMTPDMTREGAP